MKQNTQLYIYFVLLLFLMSILSSVYHKYNQLCMEYFVDSTAMTSTTDANIERVLMNITAWKIHTSKSLCEIRAFLDASIGFNQINSYSKDSKDSNYEIKSLTAPKTSINGANDFTKSVKFNEIVINDKNEVCEIPDWIPDKIEDKDSMIVYISVLIKEYNKNVLSLEEEKIALSNYIQDFNRFFIQYLDNKLLPQCDRLIGKDREKLCADELKVTKDTIAEISKKSQLLIDEKKKVMNNMMCDFVKKYKQTEYIRDAIIKYMKEVNDIWQQNDITKNKIRLNYATAFNEVTEESQ